MSTAVEPLADEEQVSGLTAQLQFERRNFLEAQEVFKQQRSEYQARIAALESQLTAATGRQAEYAAELQDLRAENERLKESRAAEDPRIAELRAGYAAELQDLRAENERLKESRAAEEPRIEALRAEYDARLQAYETQRLSDEAQREDQRAYITALEELMASSQSLRANLVEIAQVAGLRKKPKKIHPNYGDFF